MIPGDPVNTSATWKGCDGSALSCCHDQLVFLRQLVHAENSDIFEFFVALQYRLHSPCHLIVLLADQVADATSNREDLQRDKYPGAISLLNTVESRCAKVVAGDVRQIVRRNVDRLNEVIEPVFVEVMRS